MNKRGIASRLFHKHKFVEHGSNPDCDVCLRPGCTRQRPARGAPPPRTWKQVARDVAVVVLIILAAIVTLPALPFVAVVYGFVRLADYLSGLELA